MPIWSRNWPDWFDHKKIKHTYKFFSVKSFFILMFFTKKQPHQEDFKKDEYRWCLEQKKKYEKKNKNLTKFKKKKEKRR